MNRALLIFSILSLFSMVGYSQALSISPTSVEESFSVDITNPNLDLELTSLIKNESTTDTLFLKWERIIVDTPLDWQTQVCDNNLCYDPAISTNLDSIVNAPFRLLPEESFELIFHVLPNRKEGIGQFQLLFSTVDEPEAILDTITFTASVNDMTTSTDYRKEAAQLKIFPNPAFDYFQIPESELVDEIVVYSMLGKTIKTYSTRFNRQGQYDISDLSNGIYLISLVDDEHGVVKTLRLSKRDFRP